MNLQRKEDSHRTSGINNLVLYITLQEYTSYRDTAQSNPLMPLAYGNNLSCISPMSPVINNARKVHNRRSEKVRTHPIPYYNLLGTIHIIHIQGSPKGGLVLSPNDYLQRGFQTTFKIDNMTSFKILSRGTSFKMYH